ncbi:hypothetical protein [Sediminicoccus sp. KRV36]|uniref:hypothetical protein n=1 Tax=Sediminicoccus sp. KRV36 TaxID=3133721 RepID=UPI00200BB3D7|nr:hypothetical protein [Sediminicoccus rosea]UPY37623.1 hypothetical protein LHU95_02720 [Sediminicoccus rosea]
MTPNPRKLDPAWLALLGAAGVLVLVILWLMSGRAPPPAPIATAEPDRIAPMAERLDAALIRLTAAEATLRLLSDRPAGDPAALVALERQTAANRAAGDAALAERLAALEATLNARISQAIATLDAGGAARLDQRLATLEAGLTGRIGAARAAGEAAEQAQATRLAALDQARLTGEASLGQRMTNLESTLLQRLAAIEASAAQRLAPLEQALQRLGAAEARTERLAAIDALRALLDAGQPLAPALSRLGQAPPPALARFASLAPPTEPALRLSFEEALRQARSAAQEGALPRLNSLLTIRRGEDVVWGDATEANVERARRALEAGDVEGALGHLSRLPESLRQGMRAWLDEAQALAAARFALRALAGG